MNHNLIDKLEQAMRYVYARFLEEGEMLRDMLRTRRGSNPRIRHVVRTLLKQRMACTYQELCRAEGRISGTVPHHSTMHHSLAMVHDGEIDTRAINTVDRMISDFEEVYGGVLRHNPVTNRLRHYYEMPHHVLAMLVTFSEQNGFADSEYHDQLAHEFSQLSETFIKNQIARK